jgi:hypothetical protein
MRFALTLRLLKVNERVAQVRTKDQLFSSVSHLVDYHTSNAVPIISVDSELLLVTPVTRGPREM